MGEYFLQIIGKYKKEYTNGCDNIANERNTLFKYLKSISYLEPFPSQANYILCKVEGKFNSGQLSELLVKDNLLIKDLNGKIGFEEKSYVRIAVRDKNDNYLLYKALKNLE